MNTFCRLAATGANKVRRPSHYSLTTATGSKRSSADSDSLLCHVGLWRTSRLKFGCASGCEHSEMRFITVVPSAHRLHHARHALSAGVRTMRARICSAFSCAMFARVVWLKPWRAAKLPIFTLSFAARTRHAWLVRLTRARGGCFLRGRKALLNDFWYFSSLKSTIKKSIFI